MTETSPELSISLEFTPNPHTLKYAVNRTLAPGATRHFESMQSSSHVSPLASDLFEIKGISAVTIGRDFLTITKSEEGDWDQVHQNASKAIEAYLSSGKPLFTGSDIEGHRTPSHATGRDAEIEKIVCDVLEKEIRPAVAMDGGDITFDHYEAGRVFLFLQGSCAGCPSSTMTLKMGIEQRLKKIIPEVVEVVAVNA